MLTSSAVIVATSLQHPSKRAHDTERCAGSIGQDHGSRGASGQRLPLLSKTASDTEIRSCDVRYPPFARDKDPR